MSQSLDQLLTQYEHGRISRRELLGADWPVQPGPAEPGRQGGEAPRLLELRGASSAGRVGDHLHSTVGVEVTPATVCS